MSWSVLQLGYLGFEVTDLDAWERFGTEVLGMAVSRRRDDGAFTLRMDDRCERFFVYPGERDDLGFAGLEVADQAALEAACEDLAASGVFFKEADDEAYEARRTEGLVKFRDPSGLPLELFWGARAGADAFTSERVPSGFVAGDLGLGHMVVSAKDQPGSIDFYQGVLGFRLSDRIRCRIGPYEVDVTFMHCNPRHHTVAVGGHHGRRIHHFMVEAGSIDDVGAALDRTARMGLEVRQLIGRHPNDQMVSFYACTPSGFEFEFGTSGRLIDDATWAPGEYDRISDWGHRRPAQMLGRSQRGASQAPLPGGKAPGAPTPNDGPTSGPRRSSKERLEEKR